MGWKPIAVLWFTLFFVAAGSAAEPSAMGRG